MYQARAMALCVPLPTAPHTTMIRCSARPARLLAAAALLPLGALAQQVALPADLATWQCTGVCGSAAADGDIGLSPLGSARYGHLTTADSAALGVSPLQLDGNKTGTETNGSKIVSGLFSATAGQRLGLQFQYASTDGRPTTTTPGRRPGASWWPGCSRRSARPWPPSSRSVSASSCCFSW